MPTPPFQYQPMFPVGADKTEYELITSDYVHTVDCNGHQMLQVEPEALRILAERAMHDVAFYLRPAHQEQVASILSDPEASDNDKFVALTFLRNAEVSALGQLPLRSTSRTESTTPTHATTSAIRKMHLSICIARSIRGATSPHRST